MMIDGDSIIFYPLARSSSPGLSTRIEGLTQRRMSNSRLSSGRLAVSALIAMGAVVFAVSIIPSGSTIANALSASTAMEAAKRQAAPDQVAPTIIDWTTYMKTFNKHYSSATQMLVRQSLFMTRLYEVFITSIKHYLNQLSYYTSINRYSDATKEEIGLLTGGDSTQLEERDFTDEPEVNKILGAIQMAELGRRHKRATDEHNTPTGRASQVADIPQQELDTAVRAAERAQNGLESPERVRGIVDAALKWISQGNREQEPGQVIVHKDWRETGCIGAPRDQGYCESCYAFSSTAFAEWAYCRDRAGTFTRLSPQYVINCASRFNSAQFFGCDRGPTRLVPDFFREYGLELEENLPYVEKTRECHVNESQSKESWGSIRPIVEPTIRMKNNTKNLDKAIGLRPVIVSLFTPRNFVAYGGGFIDDCDPEMGGHAVLLVGSMTEGGVDYLLAQNSLGALWGLQGYFKIKRTPEFLHKCVKQFMVPDMKFPHP